MTDGSDPIDRGQENRTAAPVGAASAEPKRLTLRMREVAALTGVSLALVKTWCAAGDLPTVRIGGVVLVKPKDLEDFLEAHREGLHVRPPLRAVARRRKPQS
jgi:excisionase family DNA binding protein